ncbi:hypothetical protein B0T16DRAFT_177199 [Cercophora newfieldiana]|uniref:C2H2-type domain-containing protein n=1 Tax=Cercophora newfieldiana TaxID=92897 RepID=A0AA39XZD5_9PEZI|nr:hypothetical protein B0T16DRAFT_177199 [Cercophora newfieldiana]
MAQQIRYSQGEQGSPFTMTSHSAPGGLAPESPDSFTMDPLSQRTEMEPFRQYGLLAGQDQFGDYLRAVSHSHPGLPQDFGRNGSLPIMQFMRDAPWDPIRANVPEKPPFKSRQQGPPPYMDYQNCTQHRDTNVPSEYGADSGFYSLASVAESLARKSVVDSVYGDPDRGTETQSFVQNLSDLQLQSQHSKTHDSVSVASEHRRRDPWGSQRSPANPERISLICPTCKASVKTKAELNKHKLRHDKPFHCDVPGCSRKLGFGTQNDLARHQKSVHGADGIKYRCTEGACKSKQKNWPRADNFKQHLKRVHEIDINPDMDLSWYEYKLSRSEDLACLGTSEAQADMSTHTEWMGMDQSRGSSGPPSGEIGYSHLAPALEPPHHHHQGLVDDHGPSRPLGMVEPEPETQQASLDNGHLQLGMHPALSRFGSHQRDAHDIRVAPPAEIYQGHRPSETGVLRPSDLMTTTSQRHSMELGPSTQYVPIDKESQERPHGEDVRSRDPLEEQPLAEESGQGTPEEDLARNPSPLTLPEEDDSEDADGEVDATDAINDVRTLFPEYERAADSHVKVSHSPCPPKEPSPSETTSAKDLPSDLTVDDLVKLMDKMDKSVLEKLISKLGYQKAKEDEVKDPESPPKPAVSSEKEGADIPCKETRCLKKFKRPCELKKHMKRHEKPYACTHSDCDKRFGSKNDWKRHENSQHIQLEFWKCAEKLKDSLSPSPACGKICHRRETFKNHLDKDHGITDAKTVEKRCTDCRNGRNFESRFWCGFCEKTIEFGKNGGLAWSERFDHIDAHFTGKDGPKKDIKDWKSIELEPLETFEAILPPEPRVAACEDLDQTPSPRKRRLDGAAPSSQSKRIKSGGSRKGDHRKESVIWFCCCCEGYWRHAVTTRCMDPDCGHDYCPRCDIEVRPKPSE